MAFREFRDEMGTVWTVWDTYPQSAHTVGMPTLKGGWLTFEAGSERRRLVPVPVAWVEAPEEGLRRWLKMASPARLRLEEYQARGEHPIPIADADSHDEEEQRRVSRANDDMRALINRSRRTLEDIDRVMERETEQFRDPLPPGRQRRE
jgi:hypothetical protein